MHISHTFSHLWNWDSSYNEWLPTIIIVRAFTLLVMHKITVLFTVDDIVQFWRSKIDTSTSRIKMALFRNMKVNTRRKFLPLRIGNWRWHFKSCGLFDFWTYINFSKNRRSYLKSKEINVVDKKTQFILFRGLTEGGLSTTIPASNWDCGPAVFKSYRFCSRIWIEKQ